MNKVLAVIHARSGSKRIPNKNIRDFCGKPLIAYTIEQALRCAFVERVIVDTDSPAIAAVAKKHGAEVPFLRPKQLAADTSQVADVLFCLLSRLKEEEGYEPTHVLILQTTSPLREQRDIDACFALMEQTDATTVLTVAPTHPRLYHLDAEKNLVLGNKFVVDSTNVQEWKPAYLLNGCFVYLVKTEALLREKRIITKRTKAVICDKWRSVDLDSPEDWVVAELLYTHREEIKKSLGRIKKQKQTVPSASSPYKDFDGWNEVKKHTHAEPPRLYTVREIWWCRLGENVGTEQNGTGDVFARPCIILRPFGPGACLVVPLTTSPREHPLRVPVGLVNGKQARANLSQMRVVDTRRFTLKIGFLSRNAFDKLKKAAGDLF